MPKLHLLASIAICGLLFTLTPSAIAEPLDTDAEARALYEAGRIAFDQGRFEAALRYFEGSYELSGRPALLFNIGTAADRLRRDETALKAFRRYLKEVPDSPERPGVIARIRILEQSVTREGDDPEADEPAIEELDIEELDGIDESAIEEIGYEEVQDDAMDDRAVPSAASSKSSGKRTAGFAILGVGGASLITGAILLTLGQQKRSDLENAAPGTRYDALSSAHNADRFTGAGIGALIVGAGALTGGILMIATSGSKRDDAPVQLSVGPLGFELRGEF